jgi:hypothetical protein
MTTDPHQIQLSGEQWELLSNWSSRTGKPPEEVLSDALRHYEPAEGEIEENSQRAETVYDSLKRGGFIGCFKGGPPDLSTNPKYMEGFGEGDR